jgi:hypothetical protein
VAQYNPDATRGYTDIPDECYNYLLAGHSTEEE